MNYYQLCRSAFYGTLLISVILILPGCGVSLISAGETLREAETALCPLQTAKNVDNTIDNIFALVPLVAWEPVCSEDEA